MATLEEARTQLAAVRDKFLWQFVREETLEQLAVAPPLAGPALDPAEILAVRAESDALSLRVAERHASLASVLRSLSATRQDVAETKASVAAKLSALKASNEATNWRGHKVLLASQPQEGDEENAAVNSARVGAAVVSAALALEKQAAEASLEASALRAKSAAGRLRLQELKEAKARSEAATQSLMAELGDKAAAVAEAAASAGSARSSPESATSNDEGDEEAMVVTTPGAAATTSSLASKKRVRSPADAHDAIAEEVAELVTFNADKADATAWFDAMTSVCAKLGGVQVVSCTEAPLPGAAGVTGVEVALKLWGRHTLTLTLAPDTARASPSGDCKERLCGATLATDFESKDAGGAGGCGAGTSSEGAGWVVGVGGGAGWSLPRSAAAAVPMGDLVALAATLPAPDDVQLVVREALARLAAWPSRLDHLHALKLGGARACVVNPTASGCVVTLDAGVVVTLRLAPDYPRSSGAVVVEALTAVAQHMECAVSQAALQGLRDELSKTQWHSLDSLFEVIDARLGHLTATKR